MKRKNLEKLSTWSPRPYQPRNFHRLEKSYLAQVRDALKFSIENELVDQVKEILQTNRFVAYPQSLPRFKSLKKFKAIKEIDWSLLYLVSDSKDNCLHYAARLGKTGLIDTILDSVKFEVNARNLKDDQNTALSIACDVGWLDTVKVLISRGSDVNYENSKNKTPLILATELIYPYDFQLAKLLISNGALVNHQTRSGNTALLSASKFGNYELIELLIRANSNVNCKFSDGATALMRACYYNYPNIVELLIENNANVEAKNLRKESALYIASFRGYMEIVESLVSKHRADVNSEDIDGDTPLSVACYEDKPDVVKYLLSKGGMVNKKGIRGDTPLHIAMANCSNDVVIMLLDYGADPDDINNDLETPLHIAIRHGQKDILQTLLKSSKNLDQTSICGGRTAFKYLMENLTVEKLKMAIELIRAGCDVNKGFSGSIENRGYDITIDSPFENIFKLTKSKFRFVHQISLFGEFDRKDESGLSQIGIRFLVRLVHLLIKTGYKLNKNDVFLYENSWMKDYLVENGVNFSQMISLADLCRVRIRSIASKPLDKSIDSLDVPDSLKNFLKFF
ncbi:ankyrin repeat [Brachionus plicatilis]|uniref:Ankyrin repeat n=1 Tax=Brachionus plicatilis TaxID=10195 RepID=A0A3M7R7M4_BRAPC|nr:ankyrin repeat [Brachionus plicatilis]